MILTMHAVVPHQTHAAHQLSRASFCITQINTVPRSWSPERCCWTILLLSFFTNTYTLLHKHLSTGKFEPPALPFSFVEVTYYRWAAIALNRLPSGWPSHDVTVTSHIHHLALPPRTQATTCLLASSCSIWLDLLERSDINWRLMLLMLIHPVIC